MQPYLTCKELTTTQKKLIFNARTGMLPVEFIFGNQVVYFACRISNDTDRHLLECIILKMTCPDIMENSESVYNDVFSSDMTKVKIVANLLKSALRVREILKNDDC